MAQQTVKTAQHIATITTDQAAKAFEAWENDFRKNPDTFYTAEETAQLEVATISEGRAIHFMALLREVA